MWGWKLSILEKNLANLSKINPELVQEITSHIELVKPVEINETRCGDVNIVYDGIALHDEVDALDEAKYLVEKIKTDEDSINVFMGLGLGYHLDAASKKSKGLIAVVEPSLDILLVTLQVLDLTPLFESKRFVIMKDYQELKDRVNSFIKPDTKLTFSFLPSYYKMFPEILNSLKEEVTIVSGLINVAFNTIDENISLWVWSFLQNMQYIFKHKEIEALRAKFKDMPALIISAGPSLDKNIEKIKENQGKFVIFCVGSAASALCKNGIEPDFIVAIESGDCYGQLAGLDIENLITIPSSHKKIHTSQAKRIWNYYPNNMPDTYWMQKQGFINFNIDDYNNSGSVSFIALFSAMIAGCNPIILTGQDLAFVNGQCYTRDSLYKVKCEYDYTADSYQIKPEDFDEYNKVNYAGEVPEAMKEDIKEVFKKASKNIYFVEGQDGKRLPTDGGYVTFIKYFEEIARKNNNKFKLINSSPGGAQLNGYENMLFEDVCNFYATKDIDKKSIIEKSLNSFRNLDNGIPSGFYKELRSLYDNYVKAYMSSMSLKASINRLYKDINDNVSFQKIYKDYQANYRIYEKIVKIVSTTPFSSMLLSKQLKETEEFLNNNSETDKLKKVEYSLSVIYKFADEVSLKLQEPTSSLTQIFQLKKVISL